MTEFDSLNNICKVWCDMNTYIDSLIDLENVATVEKDETLLKDINDAAQEIEKKILTFETKMKLNNEHDINNAIVSIHAGAGGTESCDWVQMLTRMYSKWAESKEFEVEVIDSLCGDEAGIKSITMIIKGEYAYGLLQSEVGVHRLVRISPFDANKRRHTSFSSVDVIPELEDNINVVIDSKDIRIDTYRASGAGGQHINKTDSAVRITHLPTGLIVQSQNDRSQIKNRITAMKLLKSKLYELEYKNKRDCCEKRYSEKRAIEWGNQIRSYIFMPYQLVKDHRTGYEIPQVNLVINGEIDKLINNYLSWKLNR
jgi:peptide chain release factor 2